MNGVKRVPAAEGDWLEVFVDQGDDVLKVSVRGPGKDFAREKDLSRRGEVGAWGLHFVGELSSRWGVAPDPEGTAVWFEMDWRAAGESVITFHLADARARRAGKE